MIEKFLEKMEKIISVPDNDIEEAKGKLLSFLSLLSEDEASPGKIQQIKTAAAYPVQHHAAQIQP